METTICDTALLDSYLADASTSEPLFLCGDAADVLGSLPDESVDCAMTSPPYWGKREYSNGGIGLEDDYLAFISNLLAVCGQIRRVLKPTGSFWLNIGDTYRGKGLQGIPWRVALTMMDEQQWIMRNSVIWHKLKGPDNAKDKLRNVHEHVFHFVKDRKEFYYNVDAVRSKPRAARVEAGVVVSATGVSGVKYRRQIELSTSLNDDEKRAALEALEATLNEVALGRLSDFRMVIRNQQRATHSDSTRLSGRAKELQQKGFYILRYHPGGAKPGDVWDIIPEDTTGRSGHYAAYPADLCRIPLRSTCPPRGIVLDPFCGTGTTNMVAQELGLRARSKLTSDTLSHIQPPLGMIF